MSIKGMAKDAAKAAVGISLATAGLSSCGNFGRVVGPLPPPLVCLDVETGQTLVVMGELVESDLVRVLISNHDPAALWGEVEIADLAGAELVEFTIPSAQRVLILLQPGEGVTSGSFVLQGTMVDQESTTCVFSRTFTFTVQAETATVTYNPGDGLPLFARDREMVEGSRARCRNHESGTLASFHGTSSRGVGSGWRAFSEAFAAVEEAATV